MEKSPYPLVPLFLYDSRPEPTLFAWLFLVKVAELEWEDPPPYDHPGHLSPDPFNAEFHDDRSPR